MRFEYIHCPPSIVNGNPGILDLPWNVHARTMLKIKRRRMNFWVGEPGTGKTTFARHVAFQNTGYEPDQIQGTPSRELEHIWGYKDFEGDRLDARLAALEADHQQPPRP